MKSIAWQTEEMSLGPYAVQFEISAEDMSNFFEGNVLNIYWTATSEDGRFGQGLLNRKIRYDRHNGKYFRWKGYAICYEDFVNPSDGELIATVSGK